MSSPASSSDDESSVSVSDESGSTRSPSPVSSSLHSKRRDYATKTVPNHLSVLSAAAVHVSNDVQLKDDAKIPRSREGARGVAETRMRLINSARAGNPSDLQFINDSRIEARIRTITDIARELMLVSASNSIYTHHLHNTREAKLSFDSCKLGWGNAISYTVNSATGQSGSIWSYAVIRAFTRFYQELYGAQDRNEREMAIKALDDRRRRRSVYTRARREKIMDEGQEGQKGQKGQKGQEGQEGQEGQGGPEKQGDGSEKN